MNPSSPKESLSIQATDRQQSIALCLTGFLGEKEDLFEYLGSLK